MPQRATQTNAEIVTSSSSPPARVTQTNAEILSYSSSPPAFVTQANAEILSYSSAPPVFATQANAEVVSYSAAPERRITQLYAEVLVWVRSSHVWSETTFGGNSVPASGTVTLAPPPPTPVTILTPFSGGRVGGFRPQPGEADLALQRLEKMAIRLSGNRSPEQLVRFGGGLRGYGSDQEPYRDPGRIRNRKPFLFRRSIPTPQPADGEVAVIQFEVPEGYYGAITGYGWRYTGTGYVEGSTDIYWRLQVGMWFPHGLNRVRFQVGDPLDPLKTGAMIPLRPRQRVRLLVQVVNDSGQIQIGSSYILGAVCGWFFEPGRESFS